VFTCVRIFVDAVVDEAELFSRWRKLEVLNEVFGILLDSAVFRHFFVVFPLSNAFFILRELSKDQHGIFEKFSAKHLTEKLDGGLQLLV
jgi:hypothetical protein